MKPIVCFGEVLFDIFPDKKRIGGAPLNVALKLNALGMNTLMVSAVGEDTHGNTLREYIATEGLSTAFISTDKTHPTGTVQVKLLPNGNASYKIANDVAWDYILTSDALEKAALHSAAFIFGSLVCRNATSKTSLLKLIGRAPYTVFDLNLRSPFYKTSTLITLLEQVDFIKCNQEELEFLSKHYGTNSLSTEEQLVALITQSGAQSCCVTLGAEGALLYHQNTFYKQSGFPVKVKDTVGAGDAFLATLISGLLNDIPTLKALKRATAMGALVAGSEGANPKVSVEMLLEFITKHSSSQGG